MMAIYIPIRKTKEDSDFAEYSFDVGDCTGELRIDKLTGECSEISAVQVANASEFVARVIFKLRKHWAQNEYPELTSWSS
jgi:hypothetical protein